VSWAGAEADRRQAGLVRFGNVTAVDAGNARVKVSFGGESVSAWLPFMVQRAGGALIWAPPVVGEQVVVASPGGETSQGVVLGSVFGGGFSAPSGDGGSFEVHLGSSKVVVTSDSIELSSNGSRLVLNAIGARLNGARVDLN
jgi:phage baseplate assembly protein V